MGETILTALHWPLVIRLLAVAMQVFPHLNLLLEKSIVFG